KGVDVARTPDLITPLQYPYESLILNGHCSAHFPKLLNRGTLLRIEYADHRVSRSKERFMFLVTGITGHVGGATAENLLAKGHKVRALVRNPEKASAWAAKGVELVQGDFNDAAAIAAALQGVEGAYIMLPPNLAPQRGFPEAKAVIAAYVEALKRVPPPRLVLLSSIGSVKPHSLGFITALHLAEEALANFNFPIAFIRAGNFFENSIPLLPVAAQSGHFYTLYQPAERPIPSIATRDIGALAAQLLTDKSWNGRRVIELG